MIYLYKSTIFLIDCQADFQMIYILHGKFFLDFFTLNYYSYAYFKGEIRLSNIYR